MHMLLLGIEGDSMLAPAQPQVGFLDYLDRLRIPVPEVQVSESVTRRARCTPFGWNREAEQINRLYQDPEPHPPLEVVRRVNGRAFSAEVEGRHFGGRHVLGIAHTVEEITEILGDRRPRETGWVAKSEHANGAFGNRRLSCRRPGPADRAALSRLFEEDELVVVEPWRERVLDLASVFDVSDAGEALRFRAHEVVNTAAGSLIGDIFDSRSFVIEKWRPELERMSNVVAEELAAVGYFGPVCVDSFVWNDAGVERLRPVVDINARLFVGAAAERLWRYWNRDRVVYWRLFSRRRLRLPNTIEDLEGVLGDVAFDATDRCGVLVTSPLRVAATPPRRLGVVIAGKDRPSVDALDRWLREMIEG